MVDETDVTLFRHSDLNLCAYLRSKGFGFRGIENTTDPKRQQFVLSVPKNADVQAIVDNYWNKEKDSSALEVTTEQKQLRQHLVNFQRAAKNY